MKATIDRKQLVKALQEVKKTTAKRPVLPITQNVLIRANGNLTITSTDLENMISVSIPCSDSQDGELCLDPKILLDTLKTSKEKQVTIEGNGKKATVSMNGTNITLSGLDVKDFPAIPDIQAYESQVPDIPNNQLMVDLSKVLEKVLHATAKEENRPVLTGLCFSTVEGKLKVAGADGFRLTVGTIEAQGTIEKPIILNSRACAIIAKMPQPVLMTFNAQGSQVKTESDNISLISQLIQGTFPNYEQLIPKPKEDTQNLIVDCASFLSAIKQASIMAKDGSGIVRFESEGEKLIVSARAEEIGYTQVELPCQGTIKIAVNSKYIIESLNCFDGEIIVSTTSTSSPMLVHKANDTSFLEVIMPMFCQWGNETKEEKEHEDKANYCNQEDIIDQAESVDLEETDIPEIDDTEAVNTEDSKFECDVYLDDANTLPYCKGESCQGYSECFPNGELKVYRAGK